MINLMFVESLSPFLPIKAQILTSLYLLKGLTEIYQNFFFWGILCKCWMGYIFSNIIILCDSKTAVINFILLAYNLYNIYLGMKFS